MKKITIIVAAAIVGLFSFYVVGKASRPDLANRDLYNLEALRQIPVQEGGRVKPLDTFARTAMRILLAKEEFADPATDKKLPAIRWFIEVAAFEPPSRDNGAKENRSGIVWSAPAFRIDNDQVLQMLGLKPRSGLSYALKEFYDEFGKLQSEGDKAKAVAPDKRDLYQLKVLEFGSHLEQFVRINQHDVTILPPLEEGGKWESPAEVRSRMHEQVRDAFQRRHPGIALRQLPRDEQMKLLDELDQDLKDANKKLLAADPRYRAWEDMIQSYRDRSPERFDKAVAALAACSKTIPEKQQSKSRFEVFFNHFEPFVDCYAMYVFVLVLAGGAMLTATVLPTYSAPFRWSAFGLMALAFGIHTFGIVGRMYIQGRPPVTNLYSSAIFIGWGGVLLALIMERYFPYGIALTAGGVLGFATTLIAHNLGTNDTLEMMQAVLDTNFWLATHVTIVSLGYMATFVAGLLGLTYVLMRVFLQAYNKELWAKFGGIVSSMTYGVLCAATLLSFTGTVLGGIWADQSWGRFWGWDPKENGAVLIVLWNVIVLHARWGGMVKQRGIAVMTLFGSIVTAWSWFGTNMLGIGLHAYGFMEGTKSWLILFCLSQVLFMLIGLLPFDSWLSTPTSSGRPRGGNRPEPRPKASMNPSLA